MAWPASINLTSDAKIGAAEVLHVLTDPSIAHKNRPSKRNFLKLSPAMDYMRFRGFAKGWFPKGGLWRMFPGPPSPEPGRKKLNDGPPKSEQGYRKGTTVPKTRTRAHSPKPPFYKIALLFPLEELFDEHQWM